MRENPLTLYRLAKQMSIRQLSKASRINPTKLSSFEQGHNLPSDKELTRLLPVLGVDAKWLEHELMDWPGFYPVWFVKQDSENESTAAWVKHATDYLRQEVMLNLAEDDDDELRATVLSLLDTTDLLLLRWAAAAEQRQHHRACDLIYAAERSSGAAQSVYDASHRVFADPKEEYKADRYRHRYPGDDDPAWIARKEQWLQQMSEVREQRRQAAAEGQLSGEPANQVS